MPLYYQEAQFTKITFLKILVQLLYRSDHKLLSVTEIKSIGKNTACVSY